MTSSISDKALLREGANPSSTTWEQRGKGCVSASPSARWALGRSAAVRPLEEHPGQRRRGEGGRGRDEP